MNPSNLASFDLVVLGDRRHYDVFQPELTEDRNRDVAVEGLRQLGLTPKERELLTRAKRNSDNLVHLENQAFAAVASNDVARARHRPSWNRP